MFIKATGEGYESAKEFVGVASPIAEVIPAIQADFETLKPYSDIIKNLVRLFPLSSGC